jgi:hypothetical protein
MTFELALHELSTEDKQIVKEFLTVRNQPSDYPVVLELLLANVLPKQLKASFEFIQARGNI